MMNRDITKPTIIAIAGFLAISFTLGIVLWLLH